MMDLVRQQSKPGRKIKVELTSGETLKGKMGSATIRVDKSLNGYLASYSGNIRYIGNPVVNKTRQSDSSGEVIRIH